MLVLYPTPTIMVKVMPNHPFPRPHFAEMPPYKPVQPFEVRAAELGMRADQILKLDANENPYGPSPLARRALANLQYAHIYPDPESRALRRALAEFTGVPPENLLVGAGADELLDLLTRVMVGANEAVITLPPTFGMYSFDTLLNAGSVIAVPRRKFALDLAAIRRAVEEHHPKLLFIAAPNNPDGSLPPRETLKALLDLPTLVVVDEAYIEFADDALGRTLSLVVEVPRRENLVVLRTFSKWGGLAGLRVGYGAFPNWLMPILWKAKQPYNVSVAAQEAALATLSDLEERSLVVSHLRNERERLYRALQEIPYLEPYPSRANFILCRVRGCSAAELQRTLAEKHGILVRHFAKRGLEDHIRISVGKPSNTERLTAALKALGC